MLIPPHLQEWLRAWGGRLDYVGLSNEVVDLTAWMGTTAANQFRWSRQHVTGVIA